MMASLASLARELGLRIVAEGVDNHEQLGFLRRCGCDAVQAFMSCPPLPAEACTGWLRLAATRRDGGPPKPPSRVAGMHSLDGAVHSRSLGVASSDRRLATGGGHSPS
jgi:predicted signal transduction protein with EAL and GGDEF domain